MAPTWSVPGLFGLSGLFFGTLGVMRSFSLFVEKTYVYFCTVRLFVENFKGVLLHFLKTSRFEKKRFPNLKDLFLGFLAL